MSEQMIIAAASLVSIAIVALVTLRGFQGWLMLKERELERHSGSPRAEPEYAGSAIGGARIEMADLKERVRKLEAIASGVDL